jgi:osmotically inducible protein OsmC
MGLTSFAESSWTGDLATGSGSIDYVSSGAFTRMPVSWAARTQEHKGKTSPEELLAAAHASCFSMAFAARLGKNGTPPQRMEVRAEVTFDQKDGGWAVTKSFLTVKVAAEGLEAAKLQELAEDARDNCPISQALKGNVALEVDASFA